MDDSSVSRYSIIDCLVVGHQSYGLIVRVGVGMRGFVDRADIYDTAIAADAWPKVGGRVKGVVLGVTREGRVRLSTRPMDLLLISSLPDPATALREWQAIKKASVEDVVALERFCRSPFAAAILRWAFAHPSNSEEYRKAESLLLAVPNDLNRGLLGEIFEDGSE